jgi:alanyl-tRNA synthetase
MDRHISESLARIDFQNTTIKRYKKELDDLRMLKSLGEVKIHEERVGEGVFRWALLEKPDKKLVLGLVDREKCTNGKRCLLIGQKDDRTDKIAMSLFISNELVKDGCDARYVVREALLAETTWTEGKVGGRQDFAQTGGLLSVSKFDAFIMKVREVIGSS